VVRKHSDAPHVAVARACIARDHVTLESLFLGVQRSARARYTKEEPESASGPFRTSTCIPRSLCERRPRWRQQLALNALAMNSDARCLFKWIKQHLRIKAFYGTSENAVKTQIWIAISVYVLVAIIRKRLGLNATLYQILQILSLTLFEKEPILQVLQASDQEPNAIHNPNQLILFEI
jgi:hypothetical protein